MENKAECCKLIKLVQNECSKTGQTKIELNFDIVGLPSYEGERKEIQLKPQMHSVHDHNIFWKYNLFFFNQGLNPKQTS